MQLMEVLVVHIHAKHSLNSSEVLLNDFEDFNGFA